MPALHTLDLTNCSLPANSSSSFVHLQALVLNAGLHEVCDLTSCTQITLLDVCQVGANFQRLSLPDGHYVQLRELEVSNLNDAPHFELRHLGSAQKLTDIKLEGVCPSNLEQAGWPAEMASLQEICLSATSCEFCR